MKTKLKLSLAKQTIRELRLRTGVRAGANSDKVCATAAGGCGDRTDSKHRV